MPESREHAVVIGGSLAGLLTARTLTDHFDRVTVVERDRFPAASEHRAGVSQGRHLHVLWPHGLHLIEAMFPGLEEELRAADVPALQIPRDALWLTPEGWRRRFDGVRMLSFSRHLLDWSVRRRLAGSVEVIDGHEATGLVPAGRNVAGVEIRERGGGDAQTLDADLVVDATGRSSRAPEWLARLGYPFPPVTKIDPLLGYASRHYAVPDGFDPGWKGLYIQASPNSDHPGRNRTGGLFPQEGGRWIVSLSGAARDYAPTGEREFMEFARGLRSPVLYETIRDAEPLSPIVGYRRTANHRRHYERLRDWPGGFIVTGDAVCAFNPIYGQGMSVAAIQATALDGLLGDGDPRGLTRRYQRLAARCGSGAWTIATGEDLRYRETEGPPIRLRTKIVNAYVSRVVATANVDPEVCSNLLDVLGLAAGPYSLLRPAVLRRVLAHRGPQPAGPADLLPADRLVTRR